MKVLEYEDRGCEKAMVFLLCCQVIHQSHNFYFYVFWNFSPFGFCCSAEPVLVVVVVFVPCLHFCIKVHAYFMRESKFAKIKSQ